jgi:hypothetical protein
VHKIKQTVETMQQHKVVAMMMMMMMMTVATQLTKV